MCECCSFHALVGVELAASRGGAKAAFDVATSLKLADEEWRNGRALCACCQMATLASVASLLLALPEAECEL